MVGKSHIVFGVGSYLLIGEGLDDKIPFQYWLLFTPLALIGSIFPDLDHHNSRIKRNPVIWFLSIPLTLFGHRTWSHSFLILVCMGSAYFFIPDWGKFALVAFLIGYASHIIGDWMTPSGVPLFYPNMTKFRSPFTFKTGSVLEFPFAMIPLICFFVVLYFNGNVAFPLR